MSFAAGIIQSINILLVLAVWAVGITGFVMLLKVLFKLNKALDIWLRQNGAGEDKRKGG